ncbi:MULTISPECIES: hypothetical protein [Thermocrispum]|uniref:Biotin synthase auxiliary protein n=1 Tax=Thermocrispum agreste TaxID=37925 RepID=A0A2W4JN11_9PSEU|nr:MULTISPECIES: hypothetical protein [Thermocrispum]PZM99115.1 MAG: hypothetical protein DIU77_06475 [Thermocrispum agreste]
MSRYCVQCGKPAAEPVHRECDGPQAALRPPRFCPECARRMIVQVTPMGWTATCSRHGEVSSGSA